VPLLLKALQLCCKVLRRLSSHSRIPYHSMAGAARQCGCRRCAMRGTDAGTPPDAAFLHSPSTMRVCSRGITCAACGVVPACGHDTDVPGFGTARNFALAGAVCGAILYS
jgi:hypothetical protein